MATSQPSGSQPSGSKPPKALAEGRIDPAWPQLSDGEHPVTELVSPTQGSLSPFGDIEFPLEQVPYVHPVTEINK